MIMYKERSDEISEDLLREILSQDEEKQFEEGIVKKRKEAKKVVKANKKLDKLKDGKAAAFNLYRILTKIEYLQ